MDFLLVKMVGLSCLVGVGVIKGIKLEYMCQINYFARIAIIMRMFAYYVIIEL